MLGQNHFAEPKEHVLISCHPIFICRVGLRSEPKNADEDCGAQA